MTSTAAALPRRRLSALPLRRLFVLAVLAAFALALGSATWAASPRLVVTTLAPLDRATVSGSVTWQVALPNTTSATVAFAIDGVVRSRDVTAPYYYGGGPGLLDTTGLANGSHLLTATAHPATGAPGKSSVSVTVSNQATAPVLPSPTSAPVVSGTAQVSQTLSVSNGSWSGSSPMSFAYQWLVCDTAGANCAELNSATAETYVVSAGDAGKTLRARVTAANDAGSTPATSAQSSVVEAAPTTSSSIYWGAYMNGTDTYSLYGGTWDDAPWGANTWSTFESHVSKKVSIVHWGLQAPWIHDFNYFLPPFNLVQSAGDLSLVDMSSESVPLRDIANGIYDGSLTTWAQQAKAWGHPFMLRWNWEMNASWFAWGTTTSNQNTPADYVAAWRHMHDLFAQAGAANVTWVWSVNTDFPGSVPLEQLYPGDAYVDWTAMDAYNKSTATWWRSFSTMFAPTYNHLLQIAPTKPIMIAETSSLEIGGSKANWITDALSTQLPNNFPKIRAFVWFNWRFSASGVWLDYQLESSSGAQAAFAAGISSSYYAPGGTFASLPLLSKIQPPFSALASRSTAPTARSTSRSSPDRPKRKGGRRVQI